MESKATTWQARHACKHADCLTCLSKRRPHGRRRLRLTRIDHLLAQRPCRLEDARRAQPLLSQEPHGATHQPDFRCNLLHRIRRWLCHNADSGQLFVQVATTSNEAVQRATRRLCARRAVAPKVPAAFASPTAAEPATSQRRVALVASTTARKAGVRAPAGRRQLKLRRVSRRRAHLRALAALLSSMTPVTLPQCRTRTGGLARCAKG